MKSNKKVLISGVILIIAAVILKLFTAGHETVSLLFAGIGGLIIAFTILAYLDKRSKKIAAILRRLLVIILILGFIAFAFLEIQIIQGNRMSMDTEAPYIIVLGAKVNGRNPSLILSERLEAAYEYMTEYPNSIAVLSGGQGSGEDISEAEAMENYLTERGINSSRLIKEDKSTNTWENIEYSLNKIKELDSGQVRAAIVTSGFHMYRATYIAEECGIEAVSYPAKTKRIDLLINYYIRESMALVKMYLLSY